jgi:hypothetical protein
MTGWERLGIGGLSQGYLSGGHFRRKREAPLTVEGHPWGTPGH